MTLSIRPLTLREANAYVTIHHRHNKPVVGHRFSIGVSDSEGVLQWGDGLSVEEWCRRRDRAEPLLRQAFKELFPTYKDVKKDDEWYRLYNLYQATRYALHEAENPESKGTVDSYPPLNAGGVDEPMPKCEFRKEKEQ